MKVLEDVWRRTNKRTNRIEYIGAYKIYHSCGSSSEVALITKGSFDNFKKTQKKQIKEIEKEAIEKAVV